jgi:hypothetical protein
LVQIFTRRETLRGNGVDREIFTGQHIDYRHRAEETTRIAVDLAGNVVVSPSFAAIRNVQRPFEWVTALHVAVPSRSHPSR